MRYFNPRHWCVVGLHPRQMCHCQYSNGALSPVNESMSAAIKFYGVYTCTKDFNIITYQTFNQGSQKCQPDTAEKWAIEGSGWNEDLGEMACFYSNRNSSPILTKAILHVLSGAQTQFIPLGAHTHLLLSNPLCSHRTYLQRALPSVT